MKKNFFIYFFNTQKEKLTYSEIKNIILEKIFLKFN